MRERVALHDYQRRSVEFIRARPSAALWIDVGLGKTAISLTALSDLMDEFEVRNALVVAPLLVAKIVWQDEIRQWRHLRHLRCAVMVGTREERLDALHTRSDLHTINVENLGWLEGQLKAERRGFPWDMLIIDEASMFKSRDTVRFKVMRRMARKAKRVVELTATPAPNSYTELWPQFYLLDGGARLGETITGYREKYFTQLDPDGRRFALKPGADKVIQSKIRDITIALRQEDYLKLPERLDIVHKVELSPDELEVYRRLERHFVAPVAGAIIDAVSAGALVNKLLQLANGQVYDENKIPHLLHARKIEKLREIVEAVAGEPMLIIYSTKSDARRILAEFPDAVLMNKNPRLQEAWNRGEISKIVMNPKAASHGLNLQFGGRNAVWYGLTWSLEAYIQLVGRLHRQGQTKPVRNHLLVASKTADEDVLQVISGKNRSQTGLLDAMKRRIASLIDIKQPGT